jgi:uncharacterized protein YbaP (TraB family)
MMMYLTRAMVFLLFLTLSGMHVNAQKSKQPQYPSLLWEITGNGLTKPSYLFGTMHVSSKLAFHLSDSFYMALKSVDAVALELNPALWQPQMVELEKMKAIYQDYSELPSGDYLTEKSFQIGKFDDELKTALASEPAVVNSLLYRSYKSDEDFEEDTFLDLYIFQTARKLGKRTTGVEDYYESEKLMLEAYRDMAKEKKKKSMDYDRDLTYNIGEKLQEAYRRGDLDLLDSLDQMTERSEAYREKFMYQRNVIQAHSIDTILKKSSLFVGVGSGHLPGKRGVIELLRKMGYKLRPIKMTDRDAQQKESIDKLKATVQFAAQVSEDSMYTVAAPGNLYKMTDEYQLLDRRQYSDMSNGTYYLVTRVKTHAAFLGKTESEILQKVDSSLYDNIPGKILRKTSITNNGYKGFDITNKNRRGDLQRYQIFITPTEIIIFKMGGKEDYIQGPEANQFFGSIQLKKQSYKPVTYSPAQGGFAVKLPQQPAVYLNENTQDGMDRWEYEAVNPASGTAYLIFKKSVHNFRFLEKDSFDLAMIETSFRSPDFFDKQLRRSYGTHDGFPCLDVVEKLKDSSEIVARYIIKGPHYYVLAAKGKSQKQIGMDFFNSFHLQPYRYNTAQVYTDTFLHMRVNTPLFPKIDDGYRALIEDTKKAMQSGSSYGGSSSFWERQANGLFRSDSTGEQLQLFVQEYPKYYISKDSATFWKYELDDNYKESDFLMHKKQPIHLANGANGYRIELRDTGSSRCIYLMALLKNNHVYRLAAMGDTLTQASSFTEGFISTLQPINNNHSYDIFQNKLPAVFAALFSKDSATHAEAFQSISNIYYGEKGLPYIIDAMGKLKASDKDYFETKKKLIAELGYIRDTIQPRIVNYLSGLYEQVGDTSIFQKEIIQALAKHKTTAAVKLLKELLLQDPPIFEDQYEYESIFYNLEDSLALGKTLFPELLRLTTLDDYKENVLSLLVNLVDSGYVSAKEYEAWFDQLYFDAKIELKKLQSRDEKQMQKESKKEGDGEEDEEDSYAPSYYGGGSGSLSNYAVLLAPFYDKQASVPKFFARLLNSKDEQAQLLAAVLLLRSQKPVPDSVLVKLASKDRLRANLYASLERAKLTDKFPPQFRNQIDMARSCLVGEKSTTKIDSIVYVGKQTIAYADQQGTVYYFKYRVKKEDDWKIGISGLQPVAEKEVSSNIRLVNMTDKKLKEDEPLGEQYDKQLKKMVFELYKSGTNFYNGSDNYYGNFNLFKRMN